MILLDEHHPNHATDRRVGGQEGLVLSTSPCRGPCNRWFASRFLPGDVHQPVPAVLPRLTTPRRASRFSLAASSQPRPAQPADDRNAHLQTRRQERAFGVAAIHDEPHGFSGLFQERNDPFDPRYRHPAGGESWPTTALGNRRHRLLADIHQRPQRQRQRTPARMPQGTAKRDPHVPVEKWLIEAGPGVGL